MFTGIIEEVGKIGSLKKNSTGITFFILCKNVLAGIKMGDSIACNGVCLTVTQISSNGFWADVMHETGAVTNLGNLKPDSIVNLERAMLLNGRFSGHIVSGHIDCQEEVLEMVQDGFATVIGISKSSLISKNVVLRGSITVNGVSLTVMKNEQTRFSVSIIPHTQSETNLSFLKIKDKVNIEVDLFSKYVQAYIEETKSKPEGSGNITRSFLIENGF